MATDERAQDERAPTASDRRSALASTRDTLSTEVRLLGALLGDVIAEQDGPSLLELVETTRRRAIAWREGGSPAEQEALSRELGLLDADSSFSLARAFTLYFQLVNLAEERDAVRRMREALQGSSRPFDDSFDGAVEWLLERDWQAADVEALVRRLGVSPVLTAHPTEARRRTLLVALRRCYRMLEQLDDPRLSPREGAEIERRLREEISILWRSAAVRRSAPTPLDEVRTALTFFDETIFRVVPRVYRLLDRALDSSEQRGGGPDGDGAPKGSTADAGTTGTREPRIEPFLSFGSWIGGDRDGNPNVTADITRQVMRIHADHVLRGYEAVAARLLATLAIATPRRMPPGLEAQLNRDAEDLPETMRDLDRRFPDEPYRRRLGAMAERLRRTRFYLTEEAGPTAGRYERAQTFAAELSAIEAGLVADGLARVAYGEITEFRWQVETFGFHLASLELRQHSEILQAAVDALASPRPDLAAEMSPGVTLGEVLATFRAAAAIQRRFGEEACHRFVISFTRGARDVLNVLELARRAGDSSIAAIHTSGLAAGTPRLDVVPLFESADALGSCTDIVEELLADPGYREHLTARGDRQEVMLGYSDSNKETGFLAAIWMLYKAQGRLGHVAREHAIELTLFHGRGGAIGRGGGPANRGILAQAPGSVDGRFKMTEQGETIAANYANLALAERHLEQVTSAVIVASAPEHDDCVAEADGRGWDAMEELATRARDAYRALVYDEPAFETFFRSVTPIAELSTMALGSRPARRASAGGANQGIDKLRAIPWVFSWAQTRIGLPGWYGLGSAVEGFLAEHGPDAAAKLAELYRDWPFLSVALDNAAVVLARFEPHIAASYAALAGDDGNRLWEAILSEYHRSVAALTSITGHTELLEPDPDARRSIKLRRPYIDPLSYLQVHSLGRLRSLEPDDERYDELRALVQLTVNGVAAGLQGTG